MRVKCLQNNPNFRATLNLQDLDYFLVRSDAVYWRGYHYEIIAATAPPERYWQQTGVWLGMMVAVLSCL